MDVHVYLHNGDVSGLEEVNRKLDRILRNESRIMAKVDELLAELVAANETTNEIAADVDELVAKSLNGLSPAEADAVKAELTSLSAKLKDVAAKHPAPPPVG